MIFKILFSLAVLQHSSGQTQPQLVTQTLQPSQVTSFTGQPGGTGAGGAVDLFRGAASSLSQLLINLINYKMRWLGQMVGNFPGGQAVPGTSLASSPLTGSSGYPFTTTLVTTLSGNSPTIPGVTITGAPADPLLAASTQGYPQPVYPPVPQTQHGVQAPQPGVPAPQPGFQAPQPGVQAPQTSYPGSVQAPQPGVPAPQTSYPGSVQAPQPGVPAPQTSYPGSVQAPQPGVQAPQTSYPGSVQAPQPGVPAPQTSYPGGVQAPQPGVPAPQPGVQAPQTSYPGSVQATQPAVLAPQPGVPAPQPGVPATQPGVQAPQTSYPGSVQAPQPGVPMAPAPQTSYPVAGVVSAPLAAPPPQTG